MSNPSPTTYSIEEFQERYKLDPEEARRLIGAVGDGRVDLDRFMMVYRNRRQAERLFMDTHASVR